MNAQRILYLLIGGLVGLLACFVFNAINKANTPNVVDFATCAAAGYPIAESYPEQCRTPDGRMFTNNAATAPVIPEEEEGVMCTMDAMVCPDGTSVGRTGPNCEFSPCPTDAGSL